MAGTYKLTYFNGKGRAELTRLLFKLAGSDKLEDTIITSAQLAGIDRAILPLGQVPYLETDGVMLVQSMAIARYIARELNLCGDSSLDQAICDMMCETCSEVIDSIRVIMFGPAENRAESISKAQISIDKSNKLISIHRKGKFVLGDKPTLADATLFSLTEFIGIPKDTDLKIQEDLAEIAKNFSQVPNIAAYLQQRPATSF